MAIQAISLGYTPRKWQDQCHRNRSRFRVFALHRRAGKTRLALMELVSAALRSQQSASLFVYIAPFLKQAKSIAWGELKRILSPLAVTGNVQINEAELAIAFANGAVIRLFGADNHDALRGVRLDGVVVDEVAQVKPEVWYDILQPALADRQGWAIFIGTPDGINLFSELFFRAKTTPDWHSALFTVYDTQALPAPEVERLRRDMSETSFAREFLCDFAAAGTDQLIPLSDIVAATQRIYKPWEFDYAPLIIGVDPARFGDDSSVIVRRRGLICYDPISFGGLDNMSLAAKVADQINVHNPDSVFIDAGNGSGVIDRLRQMGHDVIECPFNAKPIDERFKNKRSEMWWEVREWVRSGGYIPQHQRLCQDLAAPTYYYDPSGKICLESKDDIKARGLPSSDYGDSLALTFYAPVHKKSARHSVGTHTSQYDPLAYANVTPPSHSHQSDYIYGDR